MLKEGWRLQVPCYILLFVLATMILPQTVMFNITVLMGKLNVPLDEET